MSDTLSTLVSQSLRMLLSETMLRAPREAAFIINHGEPGFVDTLKALSASTVSTPPGPGRKPIVSHANHVLFGWELVNRALHGDEHEFENVDWNAAWKLTQVNDSEWRDLLVRLEQTANEIIEAAPQHTECNEIMLAGCFATAGHSAYHLGAIRQMLRDLDPR